MVLCCKCIKTWDFNSRNYVPEYIDCIGFAAWYGQVLSRATKKTEEVYDVQKEYGRSANAKSDAKASCNVRSIDPLRGVLARGAIVDYGQSLLGLGLGGFHASQLVTGRNDKRKGGISGFCLQARRYHGNGTVVLYVPVAFR